LILDVLFFEEEVVVDPLHAEILELASGAGIDGRELRGGVGTGGSTLLAADTSGRSRRRFVLGLLLLGFPVLEGGERARGGNRWVWYLLVFIILLVAIWPIAT
jgi:hypothetical protein